jgi:hypothetical protein
MKLEKGIKTTGRRKDFTSSRAEMKSAAPPTAEPKSKTNGAAEKPKETPMKSAATQTPVVNTPSSSKPVAPMGVKPAMPTTVESKSVAAPQPTKAAAPQSGELKQMSNASRSATIEAKIDVGFGNTLYLRGEGIKGVDWNHGVPLKCVDGSTWQWSGEAADEKLKFKLLLNDKVWAKGEDIVATPGQKVRVIPSF